MQNSPIEWTDKTWNPVTGCTKVSQGCKNCYAEKLYERFNGKGSFRNVICHPERLQQPKRWKKPARIFVNSMSDLFHEDVPFQFIIDVFNVMRETPWHTYQILTKRADRMREFFTDCVFNPYGTLFEPLPNVWLGVSVEDQAAVNERIPCLLQTPAAVRFLSCEPLLGPLDLRHVYMYSPTTKVGYRDFGKRCSSCTGKGYYDDNFKTRCPDCDQTGINTDPHIDWVICGGESGHKARPMHPDWVRLLRDQCKDAGVAFFFKQWGQWVPIHLANPGYRWVNESGITYTKVGKKKAGRLLDGLEWNEFPVPINVSNG